MSQLENHAHMVALYALWYNFVRPQEAADQLGNGRRNRTAAVVMEDVVALIDEQAERVASRLADRLVG